MEENYKIWFFAGGESDDDKFNLFTGSFIRLMSEILKERFSLVKGIYFSTPMMNVVWCLNNSQKPVTFPEKNRLVTAAVKQISSDLSSDTHLILVSSSYGSAVAAQAACCLADLISRNKTSIRFFDLALGSTMVSKESELYLSLLHYQAEGRIGSIIYDDLQDEGDSSTGIGGRTRGEAWGNAFGLMCPFFSTRFSGPSFLNTHPVKGHLHRRRSHTIQKAYDFVEILMIKNKIAGEYFSNHAAMVLEEEKSRNLSEGKNLT